VAPAARPAAGLEGLGRDLTALARAGRLPKVLGRQGDIRALARCLGRTSKRNALLVGRSGVGKTALVEGLAQRAAAPDAIPELARLRILELSLRDLVAGAKYRGDLEQRVKDLLAESEGDPDLVLFLDELHMVLGPGAAQLADLLKPALQGGELRLIGATTLEEYERHLKDDAALLRRFQVLRVEEPSLEEARVICEGWARRIETLQEVRFAEGVVREVVALTARLLPERCLPDKAIDLLENAAARAKFPTLSRARSGPEKALPLVSLTVVHEAFQEQHGFSPGDPGGVDLDAVRVALAHDLVGQDAAAQEILRILGSRPRKEAGPRAFLLFTGPKGVGKGHAAACLAKAGGEGFLRLGLGAFREGHQLAKLVGAPPGFIGHERPGALFRFAGEHPRGLLLLEDFDRAHPDIQDFFLALLDRGEALDAKGRPADFRGLILVLTAAEAKAGRSLGFAAAAPSAAAQEAGELAARVDGVVRFAPLDREAFRKLAERWIAARAEASGTALAVEPAALAALLDRFSPGEAGAAGLHRHLERELGKAWAAALEGRGSSKGLRLTLDSAGRPAFAEPD
jgi:ATP-dependent Clp protease ATP-binding subunit ClpC